MERIFHEKNVNLPNMLTLLRIALLPVIVWRFLIGSRIDALVVYLIAMVTDVFDGAIARKSNQITHLGKLLDPVADKLTLLTLLVLFFRVGKIPLWVIIMVSFRESMMIIGSGIAFLNGIVVHAHPIGKLTTFVFVCSISVRFLDLTFLADMMLYASLALSVFALYWYTQDVIAKLQQREALQTGIPTQL